MSEVPLHIPSPWCEICEDRVLEGPASGGKGSKGRNWLDCIRGKSARRRRSGDWDGEKEEWQGWERCLQGYLAHKKPPSPRTLR